MCLFPVARQQQSATLGRKNYHCLFFLSLSAILLVNCSSVSFSFFIIRPVDAEQARELTKSVHDCQGPAQSFLFHLPLLPTRILCSYGLCVLIALFFIKKNKKTLVTVSQCYMDKRIIPLMEIVNSLRVRTMPHVTSVTTQALYRRQPVNIC